jgi:hypothetical protein
MRNFPSQEALVAAYWRKLARSIGAAHSGRGRVSVRRAAGTLRTRQRRASRRSSRGYSVASG